MKGLTTEQKEQVRSALLAYCDNFPTRNRAAESLQNVSSATVSQLINGKYELISDDMFTRIAVQIGFSFDSWTLHEGKTFRGAITMIGQQVNNENRSIDVYVRISEQNPQFRPGMYATARVELK